MIDSDSCCYKSQVLRLNSSLSHFLQFNNNLHKISDLWLASCNGYKLTLHGPRKKSASLQHSNIPKYMRANSTTSNETTEPQSGKPKGRSCKQNGVGVITWPRGTRRFLPGTLSPRAAFWAPHSACQSRDDGSCACTSSFLIKPQSQ